LKSETEPDLLRRWRERIARCLIEERPVGDQAGLVVRILRGQDEGPGAGCRTEGEELRVCNRAAAVRATAAGEENDLVARGAARVKVKACVRLKATHPTTQRGVVWWRV